MRRGDPDARDFAPIVAGAHCLFHPCNPYDPEVAKRFFFELTGRDVFMRPDTPVYPPSTFLVVSPTAPAQVEVHVPDLGNAERRSLVGRLHPTHLEVRAVHQSDRISADRLFHSKRYHVSGAFVWPTGSPGDPLRCDRCYLAGLRESSRFCDILARLQPCSETANCVRASDLSPLPKDNPHQEHCRPASSGG